MRYLRITKKISGIELFFLAKCIKKLIISKLLNCFKHCHPKHDYMTETEYKEKVKVEEDEVKIERESKDEFGNKVKEKHEIKQD